MKGNDWVPYWPLVQLISGLATCRLPRTADFHLKYLACSHTSPSPVLPLWAFEQKKLFQLLKKGNKADKRAGRHIQWVEAENICFAQFGGKEAKK